MAQYTFDNVSIHGFRGLRQLRLENLGRINLLVGENNCGKTSVLEAMSVLCDPFNPHEWLSMVTRRDFGGLDENRVQSLRWCFEQHSELSDPVPQIRDASCAIQCSGKSTVCRLHATYREFVGEPDIEEIKRVSGSFGERLLARRRADGGLWYCAEITNEIESTGGAVLEKNIETRAMTVWESLPVTRRVDGKRRRTVCETLTPYSYQSNRSQVRNLSGRILSDQHRNLVTDLVRQFDPDVLSVEVASLQGGRPAIYLRHRRLGPAPLSIFGDALRRAVLLASVLPAVRGGLLLIDEVETGIHTSALKRVFAWLTPLARELDVQVIATTHSLEAVDAVMESVGENLDDLATYHLEQREDQTHAARIAGDVLHRLRFDRGMDVR